MAEHADPQVNVGKSPGEQAAELLILIVAAFFLFFRIDQLPPGLLNDVGINGLDARRVLAGERPIFFENNNGREPLFIYFQAALIGLAGGAPVVFSLSGAFMGLLAVAASYRLFRAQFGWRIAALAVLLLSTSFWFVDVSRIGLRTISLLPLLAATLFFLSRLLHRGGTTYAVLGGIALGLTQYTYVAARLVPLLVILICLAEHRRALRHWRQLFVLAGVAILVFAPEGLYFFEHRDLIVRRASQVSVFNPTPVIEGARNTPQESLLSTAGMFFVRGDDNPLNNVPGRPVFDPLFGLLFVGGLALALVRARRQTAYRWPLLWLPVLLLPSALSHESPNLFRSFAAAPAAFFFPALALDRLTAVVPWTRARLALITVAILASGVATFQLYFGLTGDARTYRAYDANLTRMAAFIESQSTDARPSPTIFLALDRRAPVLFLSPRTQDAGWYREESATIPIPASAANDVLLLSSPNGQLGRLAPTILTGAVPLPAPLGPDGRPDFQAFRWERTSLERYLAGLQPVAGSMAPDFELRGFAAKRQGDQAELTLAWQPLQPEGPYDLFVHLLDRSGQQVAQADTLAWPLDNPGHPSYLLLTHHILKVPAGTYIVEIGAVHRSVSNRGQLVGGTIGDVVRLEVQL